MTTAGWLIVLFSPGRPVPGANSTAKLSGNGDEGMKEIS
jgi:hypothetical protein